MYDETVMQEHISVLIVTFAENVSLQLWQFAVFTETSSADVLLIISAFADLRCHID